MADCNSDLARRAFLKRSITLAGVAVALPSMAGLAGCSIAPASLAPHTAMIAAIVDRIIPATDTGGALAANVPDYIQSVFEQHFTREQQDEFVTGLKVFDDMAMSDHGKSFAQTSAEEQDAILGRLDTASEQDSDRAIFQHIRDLTIFGFYTSEVGPEELAYEELPGRYDGCVPLAEIGSAWLERGV